VDADREREAELLRRILQHDIDDAVARYEAETGLRVSMIAVRVEEDGNCQLEIEAKPGQPHREPPHPFPQGLVLDLTQWKKRGIA
jgi:hypothetical protein